MTAGIDATKPDRPTPENSPILNSPYERPTKHWMLNDRGTATGELGEGRRPSAPYPTVPRAGGRTRRVTQAELEMHDRINIIRERVEAWRVAGYPGISPTIALLLRHWRGETAHTRPFYCQVVAIETLVWLCDADPRNDPKLDYLREEIFKASENHNGSILRYATKMATGTGKTMVMGMIIIWQALRSTKRTDILVMVPNRTVKDRLLVLIPGNSDNVYKSLLPPNMRLPGNLKLTIVNFQAFRQRSVLGVDKDEKVDFKTRKILTSGGNDPESWYESPQDMLDRLLPSHRGARIAVINDEAHHCYRPMQNKKRAVRKDGGEVASPAEAALWFSALQHLDNAGRLGMVFDMSATPMFISNASQYETELFPWVVSDYPLIDAIEAGLTKIPRVPVEDLTGQDEPKFRNIFNYIPRSERKLVYDSMHEDVADLLKRLEEKYHDVSKIYQKLGQVPVMIVVAYPIANATALYKYLAGYRAGNDWREGASKIFSNVKEGKPIKSPVTLLVTSDIDDFDSADWRSLAIEQEAFFPANADKKDRAKHIKNVFQTVGQRGKPGEKIRCIVSVNMLTEGWDARTVTHILGYRPFKSDLLCEQVAGRALRRSNLPADGLLHGKLLAPEYAGIFGIPFSFMLGDGKGKAEPDPAWPVYTVEGRENLRMNFPNIKAYEPAQDTVRLEFDEDRVERYEVTGSYAPVDVTTEGSVGEREIMEADMRHRSAIFKLASHITDKFAAHRGDRKGPLFQSAVAAVRRWLEHDKVVCNDERLLAYPPHLGAVAERILDASLPQHRRHAYRPVFWDEYDQNHPHVLDTGRVSFNTTLKDKYPPDGVPAKSELNAAACHSPDEVRLASILDNHPMIEAWVRSHKLGWNIPYTDHKTGKNREYEPDFVARVKGGRAHLIIEFKGQDSDEAHNKRVTTVEKWIPAVHASDDDACRGKWVYVYIDNNNRLQREIDDAVRSVSG